MERPRRPRDLFDSMYRGYPVEHPHALGDRRSESGTRQVRGSDLTLLRRHSSWMVNSA